MTFLSQYGRARLGCIVHSYHSWGTGVTSVNAFITYKTYLKLSHLSYPQIILHTLFDRTLLLLDILVSYLQVWSNHLLLDFLLEEKEQTKKKYQNWPKLNKFNFKVHIKKFHCNISFNQDTPYEHLSMRKKSEANTFKQVGRLLTQQMYIGAN